MWNQKLDMLYSEVAEPIQTWEDQKDISIQPSQLFSEIQISQNTLAPRKITWPTAFLCPMEEMLLGDIQVQGAHVSDTHLSQ